MDAIFVFVLVLRRREDEGYAGEMTQECNLYIGLSHVRDGLHLLTADLRPAVHGIGVSQCGAAASRAQE